MMDRAARERVHVEAGGVIWRSKWPRSAAARRSGASASGDFAHIDAAASSSRKCWGRESTSSAWTEKAPATGIATTLTWTRAARRSCS